MKKIAVCLLLLLAADSGFGRLTPIWTYRQMCEESDLIAFAKPLSTKDTSESGKLPNVSNFDVVGLSTEFEVGAVLKGDKTLKRFVLHHYRHRTAEKPGNGPNLVSFTHDAGIVSKGSIMYPFGRSYLLFLKKESDGRYAPVTGQTDPASLSVLQLYGRAEIIDLIPPVPHVETGRPK